jgi:hypothetical protein
VGVEVGLPSPPPPQLTERDRMRAPPKNKRRKRISGNLIFFMIFSIFRPIKPKTISRRIEESCCPSIEIE